MSKLSTYIREERKRRGWTQRELAKRSGIPAATISRWERDDTGIIPEYTHIVGLVKVFEEPAATIMRKVGYPDPPHLSEGEVTSKWDELRPRVEGDPRALRMLEMFFHPRVTDRDRDSAMEALDIHLNRRHRR